MASIFIAAENGDLSSIKRIVGTNNSGPMKGLKKLFPAIFKSDINEKNLDGKTPLYLATCNDHLLVVRFLLSEGADTEVKDYFDGSTPLIQASCNGFTNIADVLLQHGANVDATDRYGQTSLWEASYRNHVSIVKLLLSYKANVNKWKRKIRTTPLFSAAQEGNLEVCTILLENGADANIVSKDGISPLYRTVQNGYHNIACCLLKYGAHVEESYDGHDSPLAIACRQGYKDITETLIKHGSSVNKLIRHQTTPLHIGCWHDHQFIVDLLIKSGAIIDLKDCCGATPLITAIAKGKLSVVILLVRSGANIDESNNKGYTPLHTAAAKGHDDLVKYLITKNAKLTRNMYGKTALDIARGKQFKRMIGPLEQYESSISDTEPETYEKDDSLFLCEYASSVEDSIKDMQNVINEDATKTDKIVHFSMLEDAIAKVMKRINNSDDYMTPAAVAACNMPPGLPKEVWAEISDIGKEITKETDLMQETLEKDFTDKHLLHIAMKISKDWKVIGGLLKVNFSVIMEILAKYESDAVFAAWHMLILWRDSTPGDVKKQREILNDVMIELNRTDIIDII